MVKPTKVVFTETGSCDSGHKNPVSCVCQALATHLCSWPWNRTTSSLWWRPAAPRSKAAISTPFSTKRLNCKFSGFTSDLGCPSCNALTSSSDYSPLQHGVSGSVPGSWRLPGSNSLRSWHIEERWFSRRGLPGPQGHPRGHKSEGRGWIPHTARW